MSPKPTVLAEAITHQGLRHHRNEDSYLVLGDKCLFAVADGMGGHRDGHVASQMAVSEIANVGSVLTGRGVEDVAMIEGALLRANKSLFDSYLAAPENDISGTTVTCLLIQDKFATCIWAGDSRLYLLRGNHLFLISEDHADDAGHLVRAIGAADALQLDCRTIELSTGDAFVLCTDGLIKGVSETQIADTLKQGGTNTADRLLAEAVRGGSNDDITFVIVWIGS
ncbi:serine/threonine-protein phosphatase Stp1 [Roseibium hamelinense]|uniref:Serine/threonine-protein phosphatase Stp1 n=1 Tax=Roseibium hamelinense TaxID=150831 RepID=A0A562SFM8_9HYPH|nr:protein phosphatase 2C domain-containing protein [Roseibium hamelinense]MTI42567.1 serine/threonine-protein phosphatase [Roseibium hamelinense]TWI79554.1 serine/threonine-protein phosphatase Stp1 [Roseibium hamelinense]